MKYSPLCRKCNRNISIVESIRCDVPHCNCETEELRRFDEAAQEELMLFEAEKKAAKEKTSCR